VLSLRQIGAAGRVHVVALLAAGRAVSLPRLALGAVALTRWSVHPRSSGLPEMAEHEPPPSRSGCDPRRSAWQGGDSLNQPSTGTTLPGSPRAHGAEVGAPQGRAPGAVVATSGLGALGGRVRAAPSRPITPFSAVQLDEALTLVRPATLTARSHLPRATSQGLALEQLRLPTDSSGPPSSLVLSAGDRNGRNVDIVTGPVAVLRRLADRGANLRYEQWSPSRRATCSVGLPRLRLLSFQAVLPHHGREANAGLSSAGRRGRVIQPRS